MKTGRPSEFTEEIAKTICDTIATSSRGLKSICELPDMPTPRTVLSWLAEGDREDGRQHFKDFLQRYMRAKDEQADFMVDEMIEIADDGSNDLMTVVKGNQAYEMENKEVTNRSKLRVETRKWIAMKLKPKKYGDKFDHTHEVRTIVVKTQEDE